jgi:hypothetical protein
MCADLTGNSGGIALFNGAEQLEKRTWHHLHIIANLPSAHRFARSSALHATIAGTIYILTVCDKKVKVLPDCKHDFLFVGALQFSGKGHVTWSSTTAGLPLAGTATRFRLLHDFTPLL